MTESPLSPVPRSCRPLAALLLASAGLVAAATLGAARDPGRVALCERLALGRDGSLWIGGVTTEPGFAGSDAAAHPVGRTAFVIRLPWPQ